MEDNGWAIIGIIVIVILIAIGSGNTDGTDPATPPEEALKVEIANFDYGFIEEENYKDRETTIADTNRISKLKADTVYYCMIEFDFCAREENDGSKLINVLVMFSNLGVTNGTTEETSTGNVTEMIITDAETGNDGKVLSHAYKVPSDPNSTKKIRILIRLLPVSVGESKISLFFEAMESGNDDKESEKMELLGDNGFSQNLEVVKTELESPYISVDRNNLKLKWNHVKNADYYIIYFANTTITYSVGIDEYTAVGTEFSFNLSEFSQFGVEYGDIKVKACSDNNNFIESSYSNVAAGVRLS